MGWDRQLIFGVPLFRWRWWWSRWLPTMGMWGHRWFTVLVSWYSKYSPETRAVENMGFLSSETVCWRGRRVQKLFPALVRELHRFAPSTREIGVEGPIIVLPGDTSASAFVSTNGIQAFFFHGFSSICVESSHFWVSTCLDLLCFKVFTWATKIPRWLVTD